MVTHKAVAGLGAAACALGLSLVVAPGASAAPDDAADSPRGDSPPRTAASHPQRAEGSRHAPTATRRTAAPAAVASRTTAVPRSAPVAPRHAAAAAATSRPRAAATVSPAPVAPNPVAPAEASVPVAPAEGSVPVAQAAATTAPANPIGDLITGALVWVQRRFFNQNPTAAPEQAMIRPSGQVWGFVAATDPEGDRITYALKQSPQFGTVSVTDTGVYTYTPGADFVGTDTFTVAIDDPEGGINLLDLFGLFGTHPRDITVSVGPAGDPASGVVDTFDGPADSAPDPALWGYHLGPWRDAGLQTYTDSPDNVRLDGQGNLVIQARNTPDGYTSTRLVTQDKLEMQYGVVQARIKMPAGQGIWPAFWMLGTSYRPEDPAGWPECGEIDIMEVVNTGTQYTVALHGPQGDTDYYGGAEVSGQFVGNQGPISAVAPISDLTAGYHDYWTMWREDHIVIGVDDTMLGDFTPASLPEGGEWVFNQPMYGILQIAVGGPWPGPPDETTPWPATMLVDSFSYTPLS